MEVIRRQKREGDFASTVPTKRPKPSETQEEQWVAQEDQFVLQQAKKKAEIRVKEGRARPIDWMAVTLRVTDPERDLLDEEVPDAELDLVDPNGVMEGLDVSQLAELEGDIQTYLTLEKNRSNRDFWMTLQIICKDRRQRTQNASLDGRAASSVSSDVDKLLAPKTIEQLEVLEKQIDRKLASNEPIDVDYWENLLSSLKTWKAKAKLKKVHQSIIHHRLETLRQSQQDEAHDVAKKLETILPRSQNGDAQRTEDFSSVSEDAKKFDAEPLLKLRSEDKNLEIASEDEFLEKIVNERRRLLKLGFVPVRQRGHEKSSTASVPQALKDSQSQDASRYANGANEDFSQVGRALYEREVARGIGENEELFTGEEEVNTTTESQWASKHRPRKPRYFNRVQMGYEWNKYNQTHYDHENPPPKVVQGYKFNIFYPDLIDKTKAPTYRIQREHGRKRGQSFAPAGEEDTCLIRFVAGPPYQDIAFRIVDKEWDYSAKHERGFKSSFDKGILQLHFQFKKIYYRK